MPRGTVFGSYEPHFADLRRRRQPSHVAARKVCDGMLHHGRCCMLHADTNLIALLFVEIEGGESGARIVLRYHTHTAATTAAGHANCAFSERNSTGNGATLDYDIEPTSPVLTRTHALRLGQLLHAAILRPGASCSASHKILDMAGAPSAASALPFLCRRAYQTSRASDRQALLKNVRSNFQGHLRWACKPPALGVAFGD